MSSPFFSVIIPTFNRMHTIERAINSVLNQSYNDFELIVVDDGSTDDTQSLLKKYNNIEVISTENQGVSKARNLASLKARGKWLAFLDSDDEWLSNKLLLQKNYIDQNPECVLVHGQEIWIRNGVRVNQMNKHKKGGGDQFGPSLKLCVISPSVAVIKKEVFNELGMFREDYPACEDYDLWLKLTSLYEVGHIDEFLIKKFGGHEDQLSAKYIAMDYWRVCSIDWILKNRNLNDIKRKKAIEVLKKKAKILIKGYQRHNNLKNLPTIQKILDQYL